MMKKALMITRPLLVIAVVVFAGQLFWSTGLKAQDAPDTAPPFREIMTRFQQAIAEKDSVAFQKLFFHEKVTFTGIMSEKTEASIQQKNPAFQGISVSNSQRFIREICSSPQKQAERFYHVKTDTAGRIATISFDYSFLTDDRMVQWGHEKWNLVLAEGSWWITDVVFSIHFPAVEPFPYGK